MNRTPSTGLQVGVTSPTALIPSVPRPLPLAVSAQGATIVDSTGQTYIDGSSGPLAVTLGHGHPAIIRALTEQLGTVDYVHRAQMRSQVAEDYAAAVVDRMGVGLDYAMMVSSGSEAIELAMKFAYMYWSAKGRPEKSRFISTDLSYHGNTLGALSSSGQPRYGAAYRPLLREVDHFRAPKTFRLPVPRDTTAATTAIRRLREDLEGLDLTTTAALMLESVGGSGGGVLVPPDGFLEEVRRICDEHELLWIADEVMTGFGRTGTWFGFQHSRAVPDIVAFAKGAGGGVVPLGGAALSAEVWEQILELYPAMSGGHTFANAAASCAVGLAVISTIERELLLDRVTTRGAILGTQLRDLQDEFPFVGDVRGIGYMWALEFVTDARSLQPPDPASEITNKAIVAAARHGLLLYPAKGCADGAVGDAVMIAPPLTTSEDEFDQLIQRLRAALGSLSTEFATTSRQYPAKDEPA